jgi:cytochrome d ubiquinol oxidase subunit II
MTLAEILIGVFWAGLTAYAVLGGADFGAGVLHLLAPAGRAGRRRRLAIWSAMGPVWEANHVWLIFFLTGLMTTFPPAFAALGPALLLPATIALLGIVVRGAALAFAAQLTAFDRARRPLVLAFGVASGVAPAAFGAIAGGLARQRLIVAHGAVRAGGGLGLWLGPFQAATGMLALAACVALAACFLVVETKGDPTLASNFRAIALNATAATAALAAAGLALAHAFARPLFDGLTSRGLAAVAAGLLALLTAFAALASQRDRLARLAIVTAVAAVMWGWGLAQYPRLVGPGITVGNSAATAPEVHAIAVALAAGAAVLAPSLWLLYGAFRRDGT